jgi:hypothetical protein
MMSIYTLLKKYGKNIREINIYEISIYEFNIYELAYMTLE